MESKLKHSCWTPNPVVGKVAGRVRAGVGRGSAQHGGGGGIGEEQWRGKVLSFKKNPRAGLPHEVPVQEVGDQGRPEAGLFLHSQSPHRLSAGSQAWGSSTREGISGSIGQCKREAALAPGGALPGVDQGRHSLSRLRANPGCCRG